MNVYLLLFTESLDRTCLNTASDFSRKKKKEITWILENVMIATFIVFHQNDVSCSVVKW